MKDALNMYDPPHIFNTDQGVQFTCDDWIYTLVNWGINPSMTGVGRCIDNIHSECFWRTLKYENSYLYGYESMKDARQKIDEFIKFYNQQRPHESLGYKTPKEVYYKHQHERRKLFKSPADDFSFPLKKGLSA